MVIDNTKYNLIHATYFDQPKQVSKANQLVKVDSLSPYDKEAYIAYLEIDKKGNIVDKWNNMIIEDDTIIEFIYKGFDNSKPDYIKNQFLRWVPLRTRHDKTQTYKIGINKKNRIINILDTFLIKKKELVNYLLHILKQIRTDESGNIEKELIKINKSNNRQEVLVLLSELITTFSNNLYNDIYRYITNTTYSSNVIRPIRRNMHITTYNQPKKEIELIPIKKYVVIQSPDQQFSIGVEVEPLSI